MKKSLSRFISILLVLSVAVTLSFTAAAETKVLEGTAEGFGGKVTVEVKVEDDEIISVEAYGDKETEGIGTPALEEIPQKIIEANSTDVDLISGATYTSEAVVYAVNNALNPEEYPAPDFEEVEAETQSLEASELYQGFGLVNNGRIGPGKDNTGTQVYSFNEVYANVLFDEDGKIVFIHIDELEVATPNYDGKAMPHLSGFPPQGGYNFDEDHDQEIEGKTPATDEYFLSEIDGWKTKRERGENYVMSALGTWADQMDTYEELFVGMTVDEVEEWFANYTDQNGRPIKADSEAYSELNDDEQEMLADVTSGATMSLSDGHGYFIKAIKKAYENRFAVEKAEEAVSFGFGLDHNGRIGPGKDNTGTQVYSFNNVFVNTLFNEKGEIVSIFIDELEVATPNYDGKAMPHLSGFPPQGGYNFDEDHDQEIDGKTPATDEYFLSEIDGWKTKRERGENYVMSALGTWADQMDTYEELFVGMTVDEVEEWFANYTDQNGRPIKADSEAYSELNDDEQEMLADVTSGATMSLSDAHGYFIEAIRASYENRIDLNLNIK
ncbi:FMN-binding protein [Halanaerobium congolense]|nr:FMN-binding protein [Halanaerobium congolense]PTX17549.1 FMN-binding protein [Halanaerobium congolense]